MENSKNIEDNNTVKGKSLPIGGIILILLGVMFLINELINLPGSIVIPSIGLIFAVAGVVRKKSGLMVPAGILIGLGAGIVFTESGLTQNFANYNDAIILAGIASGFFLVTILSIVFTGCKNWWGLIVGSFVGLLASIVAIMESPIDSIWKELATNLLSWSPYIWPVVLIILGLGILLRRKS